jgi:hypothetical protein
MQFTGVLCDEPGREYINLPIFLDSNFYGNYRSPRIIVSCFFSSIYISFSLPFFLTHEVLFFSTPCMHCLQINFKHLY